jgi:hypothetical protein
MLVVSKGDIDLRSRVKLYYVLNRQITEKHLTRTENGKEEKDSFLE